MEKFVEEKIADGILILGKVVQKQLREEFNEQRRIDEEATQRLARPLSSQTVSAVPFLEAQPLHSYTCSTSEEIKIVAKRLARYSGEQPPEDIIERSINIHVYPDVIQQIQQWFRKPKSNALWVCGPFQASIPSRNTLTGAYMIRVAREASIPVLAYFCPSLSDVPTSQDGEFQEQELLDMVYSLISQMLNALQEGLNTHQEHIDGECRKLDESAPSLPAAISVLKELIALGPGLVLCIVDGIQNLANRIGCGPNLKSLNSVLREPPDERREPAKQVVKTLFTTDGFTPALIHLGPEERLDLSNLPGHGEAEFGPGYTGMAFLTL